MFLTPPTLTEDFRKIDRGLFRKKARRRRKIFGVPFFKNLTVFGKKLKNKRFFNGFQCLHDEKSPPLAKNLGTPFFARRRRAKNFPTWFSFSSDLIFILVRYPPWKNLAITYVYRWSLKFVILLSTY